MVDVVVVVVTNWRRGGDGDVDDEVVGCGDDGDFHE